MSLVAEQVGVRIGSSQILSDVSITVNPGEVLGLIGPNGAGKSTLLSVLSGERAPDAGTVRFEGRTLDRWQPLALARRRAVMPQAVALAFDFPVCEVVGLGRYPHAGLSSAVRDRCIVEQAMAAMEVAHLACRPWSQLSGGERQRAQAARALAQVWEAPRDAGLRLLLLDEPTSNLDLRHQHALLDAARRFVGRFECAVVVLHDVNLAALYCDRIAVLEAGRVVAAGTVDETLDEALLSRVYRVGIRRVFGHDGVKGAFLVEPPKGTSPVRDRHSFEVDGLL